MDRETKRVRMFISGRVQGVFYRAYTLEEARRLGLRGWVMNLPDGRVEVLAEGEPDRLTRLKAWCWQGPPYALVRNVDVREEPVKEGEFTGFDVRHSPRR